MPRFPKIKAIYLLPLLVIVAFWQVAFFQHPLKWDALDISFPWRFIVVETVSHGELPLWNPFQFLGFGQHADPQTWYPLFWLFAPFGKYSLFSLSAEYLFHIALAGFGFFRLTQKLKWQPETSIILAATFMCSGFFVGNAQHLGWIVSGAWIPHLFASYLAFIQTRRYQSAIATILVLFMLLSGGYIAFFITSIYLMAGLFVAKLVTLSRQKQRENALRFIRQNLWLGLLFMALSAVIIVSLFDLKPVLHRGDGLTLQRALSSSFYPIDLLSLIVPAAQRFSREFWINDQSMVNVYHGFLPLLLSISWLFSGGKTRREKFFFIAMLFFLGMAMGQTLPLRTWSYYVLPLFNYFRIPALFRFFFIAFNLLLAGSFFQRMLQFEVTRQRKLLLSWVILWIGLLATSFLMMYGHTEKGSLQSAAIQGGIQLGLIGGLFFAFRRKTNTNMRYGLLFLVVSLDMFQAVQGNIALSVYESKPLLPAQHTINQLPEGFPLPDASEPISAVRQTTPNISPLWRNIPTLYKKVDYSGYTPYQYRDWLQFEASDKFDETIAHGLLFFSDTAIHKKATIQVIDFGANFITLKTNQPDAATLVYQQNLKKGWQATANNRPLELHPYRKALISVRLPKGENLITFRYRPKAVIIAFWISVITLIVLLISLFITLGTRIPKEKKPSTH